MQTIVEGDVPFSLHLHMQGPAIRAQPFLNGGAATYLTWELGGLTSVTQSLPVPVGRGHCSYLQTSRGERGCVRWRGVCVSLALSGTGWVSLPTSRGKDLQTHILQKASIKLSYSCVCLLLDSELRGIICWAISSSNSGYGLLALSRDFSGAFPVPAKCCSPEP